MAQAEKQEEFSLLFILDVVKTYLWYLVGVVGISALLAIIFTMPFLYPPEYLAMTTVYPTSPERFDVINIFHEEPNLYLYGGAKEVEKLDNIANSEVVRMHIIDKLDLWKVYGYDKTDVGSSPKFYVLQTFASNVAITRVAGNGLQISAYDIDPQRAADIVNLMAERIDAINKEMINLNKVGLVKLYREGQERLRQQLVLHTDSAHRVRDRFNVLRSVTQSEIMTEQIMQAEGDLAEARSKLATYKSRFGNTGTPTQETADRVKFLQSRIYAMTNANGGSQFNLENFRAGIDQIKNLEDINEHLSLDIKNMEEKVQYLEMMDLTEFSTIMAADKAYAMDKKARPVRWIILAATILITALVSVIGVILIDAILKKTVSTTDA